MILSASGNCQVRAVSHDSDEATFSPSVLELVVPTPPVTEEQNPTPTRNTTSGSREPLGLTEEEEKELAELMEDGI
jgi:hypothetical protein